MAEQIYKEDMSQECSQPPQDFVNWRKQQEKTYISWCNSHLRKVNANAKVECIYKDFTDGKLLITLLEVISGELLPKPEQGKMRFHHCLNVNKALTFIKGKVQIVNIGAEDIVDSNECVTLGLIWTIILRFAIQEITIEDMTAKEGLLLWCQRKTEPYSNVNVTNFHTSFQDGLAFCALIHRHRPELIDFHNLDESNREANLNLAFDVAEKHLDIPRMLDAEDMIKSSKPDERAVMTYVSSYYHAFTSALQAETAASRISRALMVNQEHEKLKDDYESNMTSLLERIKEKILWLENREAGNNVSEAQIKLEAFRGYRADTKPGMLEEKAHIETTFNTMQNRLRLNNRPAYIPAEGKKVSDLILLWKGLERAEKGFEEWILNELQRLEQLDMLARKFKLKCDIHEEWTEGKEAMLTSVDIKSIRLYELKALTKMHEAFESDLKAQENRLAQINEIAEQLITLGYYNTEYVITRRTTITEQWTVLQTLTTGRRSALKITERFLEKIDEQQLEFAKRAATFNNWMDGAREDLSDMFIVHSIEEIQRVIEGHEQFKSSLGDAQVECKSIMTISEKVIEEAEEFGISFSMENPYTKLTAEYISNKWEEVCKLVPGRDAELEAELSRQDNNENLREQFAANARKIR